MSAHPHRIAFAPRAQQDYDDILLYSLQTWGIDQMAAYQGDVDQALNEIAAFPEIGRHRPDYFGGCRTYPVRSHIVFYEVRREAIAIVRILHQSVDVDRHLFE